MEKHVQNAAFNQHPDDVRMDVGWRDLVVMQELLEEIRERKVEPHVKLLIAKEDGIMSCLLGGRWISIHQLNGDTIQNEEMFPKFPLIKKLSRLPRTRASGTHACPTTLFVLPSRTG